MHIPKKQNNGFALLLAIIISSVVIAIGIAILHISVSQINLASSARESEIAFQTASAGIDCLTYWRSTTTGVFEQSSNTTSPVVPTIKCFNKTVKVGDTGVSAVRKANHNSSGDKGQVYLYTYQFDFGAAQNCLITNLYVMQSSDTDDLQFDFSAFNADAGDKTCKKGNVCNVLISDGYNRSCTTLSSSIFSVQRELTQQF